MFYVVVFNVIIVVLVVLFVFDTKYISSTGVLGTIYNDTVLGELYNQLMSKNNGAAS